MEVFGEESEIFVMCVLFFASAICLQGRMPCMQSIKSEMQSP
jgi:hypothetical protein